MRETQRDVTGERLTWTQILARYPDQYIALVDDEGTPAFPDFSGVVYANHPDRKTLLRISRGPSLRTILFTGESPRVPFRLRFDVD